MYSMGKTAPAKKLYNEQEDSPYVANARKLMQTGYNGLNEYVPRVNTMDERTRNDLDANLGAIYGRAEGDFDRMYRDTMANTMAQNYGRAGTLGGTPNLYRTDMDNLQAQRKLADLAYNKATTREDMINSELGRRYNTMDMYNKLYGYGAIPQKYDDQNYQLREITNVDRAYENDMNEWNTQQKMLGTASNAGMDVLGIALAPYTGGASLALSQMFKPAVTGMIAPNAQGAVGGMTGDQASGWADFKGIPNAQKTNDSFFKDLASRLSRQLPSSDGGYLGGSKLLPNSYDPWGLPTKNPFGSDYIMSL